MCNLVHDVITCIIYRLACTAGACTSFFLNYYLPKVGLVRSKSTAHNNACSKHRRPGNLGGKKANLSERHYMEYTTFSLRMQKQTNKQQPPSHAMFNTIPSICNCITVATRTIKGLPSAFVTP